MTETLGGRTGTEGAVPALAAIPVQTFRLDDLQSLGGGGEISSYADMMLRREGGFEVLLSRLMPAQRRLWRSPNSSQVLLDACLLKPVVGYLPEELAMTATRLTPTGRAGNKGVLTVVGRRVRGSNLDVMPVGVDPALAFTANAIVCWRQKLQLDTPSPETQPPKAIPGVRSPATRRIGTAHRAAAKPPILASRSGATVVDFQTYRKGK